MMFSDNKVIDSLNTVTTGERDTYIDPPGLHVSSYIKIYKITTLIVFFCVTCKIKTGNSTGNCKTIIRLELYYYVVLLNNYYFEYVPETFVLFSARKSFCFLCTTIEEHERHMLHNKVNCFYYVVHFIL